MEWNKILGDGDDSRDTIEAIIPGVRHYDRVTLVADERRADATLAPLSSNST